VAGLGLTGLVTWAEVQLHPIHNPFMQAESIRFGGLDEFFAINHESERDFTHTVAWIDCLAKGRSLGRGLYNRGFHAGPQFNDLPKLPKSRKAAVPINFPGFALGSLSVKAFNFLYYRKQLPKVVSGLTPYAPFFYPLDAIESWNRIYGKRGFFQYQLVVPEQGDAIRSVLQEISKAREGSFLAVLKTFGALKSPGLMSFPRPGVTLALDFANHGARSLALFERLDAIVREHGGAVYPAKDARMSGESFRRFFPQWERFSGYVDPGFSSSFWRRVTAQG
jgi:FAD/FMN-containing dehydrogenase